MSSLSCPLSPSSASDRSAFAERLDALRRIEWLAYVKPPLSAPAQVLADLGRYTHRVAIANSRLTELRNGEVSCTGQVYHHHGTAKQMTSAAMVDSPHRNRLALLSCGDARHATPIAPAAQFNPESISWRNRRVSGSVSRDLTEAPIFACPVGERGRLGSRKRLRSICGNRRLRLWGMQDSSAPR